MEQKSTNKINKRYAAVCYNKRALQTCVLIQFPVLKLQEHCAVTETQTTGYYFHFTNFKSLVSNSCTLKYMY